MPLRDPAKRGLLLAVLAKARRIREAMPDPAERRRLEEEGWLVLDSPEGLLRIRIAGRGPTEKWSTRLVLMPRRGPTPKANRQYRLAELR